jgi:hypothetical protein
LRETSGDRDFQGLEGFLERGIGRFAHEQVNVLRHYDVPEEFELIVSAGTFERVEEDIFGGLGVEVRIAVVATEGDEMVVAFLLVSLEPERHGMILEYRVRALRECPHLRIEIWGTRLCLCMGHPP